MIYKPLLAMLLSIPLTVSPLFVAQANDDPQASVPPTAVSVSSSTESVVMPPLENMVTVSSSTDPLVLTPSVTSTTETPSTATSVINDAPTSTMLCLAIIEPAPLQGLEWVAFYGLTPSTTSALIDWSLADAQGSLLKFSHTSVLLWDEQTKTIRIELKSARLNNTGDTVTLKNPLGEKHDEYIYPAVEKGERWMRESCTSPWHRFPEKVVVPPPTPVITPPLTATSTTIVLPAEASLSSVTPTSSGTTVVVSSEEDSGILVTNQELPPLPTPDPEPVAEPATLSDGASEEVAASPVLTSLLLERPPEAVTSPLPLLVDEEEVIVKTTNERAVTTVAKVKATPSVKKITPTKKVVVKKPPATTSPSSTKKKTPSKTTVPKSTATKSKAKKTPAAKKSVLLTSLSMSSLIADPEAYQGIRVRVRGRVASDKSILGAHRFVIANTDGRGLIIHATSKQLTPPIGTLIDVTGTVVWNDEGLWIKQSTTDQWIPAPADAEKGSSPVMNHPNLNTPSQEDAWSLVRIEGIVSDVQKASFDLDVNGSSIHVRVSNLLGYRVARLQKNDRVSVSGILDLRSELPNVVPQATESIQIVERAKMATPVDKAPVSRPWLPVGAAASTLGLSEGWRRLRDRQKRRREEASFKALKASYQEQG